MLGPIDDFIGCFSSVEAYLQLGSIGTWPKFCMNGVSQTARPPLFLEFPQEGREPL